MAELSFREKNILVELLKNCKVSDREMASKLRTSQPTVTRLRNKLWQKGFVSSFTVIPSLSKIGLGLMMFTFFRRIQENVRKDFKDWIKKNPEIVFSSEGEGLREDTLVIVSVHPQFDAAEHFLNDIRTRFGEKLGGMSSFFTPVRSTIKEFNLSNVVEYHITHAPSESSKKKS